MLADLDLLLTAVATADDLLPRRNPIASPCRGGSATVASDPEAVAQLGCWKRRVRLADTMTG